MKSCIFARYCLNVWWLWANVWLLWAIRLECFMTLSATAWMFDDFERYGLNVWWLWALRLECLITLSATAWMFDDFRRYGLNVWWLWTLQLQGWWLWALRVNAWCRVLTEFDQRMYLTWICELHIEWKCCCYSCEWKISYICIYFFSSFNSH